MRLVWLSSRSAILAVAVISVSLILAFVLNTEDPAFQQAESAVDGSEFEGQASPDLVSLMQSRPYVERLGQYDKGEVSAPRPHFDGNIGLPGTGLGRSSLNMALSMRTALMQSLSRVRTAQFTSTLAVIMIILMVSCTCVGALSIVCPSKFSFLGGSHHSIPHEPFARGPHAWLFSERDVMPDRKSGGAPPGVDAAGGGAPGHSLGSGLPPFASALMSSTSLFPDYYDHYRQSLPARQETEQANTRPPTLCKSLVLPDCEARFGVPMIEVADLRAEGEINIVGISGVPLLRAVVRKIENARMLEITSPEPNSAPKATVQPSPAELAGHSQQGCRALEIRGLRGSPYGVLEMRSSGACCVKLDGQTMMMIDGDHESLTLSIKSSSGSMLASVRCSAEPFGGDEHIEIRVEAGVDTVLVLAVVLAVLLLSPYAPPPQQ